MFFCNKGKQKNKKTKASLRTCHKYQIPNLSDNFLNPKNENAKRTFSFSPFFAEASMCLEAALSFSFFLIFFTNLLSLILLFTSYTKSMEELQQKAKEQAIYAYLLNQVSVGDDILRLRDTVEIKSTFPLLGFDQGTLQVGCVVKPWTGYHGERGSMDSQEEEMVYKAENGRVYHRKRDCTHLSLSIQMISYNLLGTGSNAYSPCDYCYPQKRGEREELTSAVYVTNFGNRYHRSVSCQGLKRTISCIPISQVEGIPECVKCR